MSDLRTTQTLAYLTHQPARYREVLGLPREGWQSRQSTLRPLRPLRPLLNLSGRLLTRAGQWLLARAGEPEEAPAVAQKRQMA